MDYSSILVTPVINKREIMAAEGPLRNFTKLATEVRELNYWDRLRRFKLYSNQRRMEIQVNPYMEISEWILPYLGSRMGGE